MGRWSAWREVCGLVEEESGEVWRSRTSLSAAAGTNVPSRLS